MRSKDDGKKREIQLYGPSFSNFIRSIILLCEEHNIAYHTGFELDGLAIEFKSEQHFALHPYGKLPILKHGDFILVETAAICRYLLNTFAPDFNQQFSLQQQAKIDSFSAIASIYLDKAIIRDYLLEFAFPKGENGQVRFDVVKAALPQVETALKVIDNELVNGDSLNGDLFTVSDAIVAPMLHYLSCLHGDFNPLAKFPTVEAYLTKLMARASCQKVLTAMV